MPNYPQPNDQWLASRLTQLSSDVAALKATRTQYVIDAKNVCQAIIGHLQHDHQGNPTGLGDVWGIASFKTGAWVRL